jgi:hypothetical protein
LIAESGWLVVELVIGVIVGLEYVGAAEVAAVEAVVVPAAPVEVETETCFVVLRQSV